MRYFRLAIALFCFYTAYDTHEWFFVVFGLFFAFQALFNLGCQNNSCGVTYKNQNREK
jgi:VanZ family protein